MSLGLDPPVRRRATTAGSMMLGIGFHTTLMPPATTAMRGRRRASTATRIYGASPSVTVDFYANVVA
ncbi:hypothetical protein ACLB2K_057351 [Fragaria x ananassa]